MLSFQYHRVLRNIANSTFPDHTILPFQIEINPKEMKSRHGDYHPGKRVIRIFNLSQKVDYIIATALHELAHHCEFSIYRSTGHSKRFYEVFKDLLETAVSLGVVDYEVIRLQENANDLNMLEKHFGRQSLVAKSLISQDETVIKVLNSFNCKEQLKEKKYFYDQVEKGWGKIIPSEEVENELSFLRQYVKDSDIIQRSLYDLRFEAIYYVFIPNGFDKRVYLKDNGYFFKQIKKTKGWAKKIVATDLDEEKKFLHAIAIDDFKIKSSLT